MIHFEEFPFEELRDPQGGYWRTLGEARAAGFADTQIWSVVIDDDEDTITYGPYFHYVNLLGYTATKEHNDHKTYYVESIRLDEED